MEHPTEPADFVDGIYFGLDEDVYHAIPRLSCSGLQNMMVSPATFWFNSWLNPDPKEVTEEQKSARLVGRAYHCARLEPDAFAARYVRDISIADFEQKGLVRTGTDIKEALGEMGLTKSKAGEVVAEAALRLHEAGYKGVIWPLEVQRFNAALDEMNPRPRTLAPDTYDQMVRDMTRIKANPEIHKLLSGGASEVSVLWRDSKGIKMKARIDYLRSDGIVDFKTFDNSRGKPLNAMLNDALRYNKYYVQPAIYLDAFEAARQLPVVQGEPEHQELVAALQLSPRDPVFHFVFQEKGGVPNLLAREFEFYYVDINIKAQHAGASPEAIARVEKATREPTLLYNRALFDVGRAKATYLLYCDVYEAGEEWLPLTSVEPFRSEEFNKYWLSGEYE